MKKIYIVKADGKIWCDTFYCSTVEKAKEFALRYAEENDFEDYLEEDETLEDLIGSDVLEIIEKDLDVYPYDFE